MILYRDLKHAERTEPPEWLLDRDGMWAPNLQSRDDADGRLWGIGDAYMVGPHKNGWEELTGGWQVRLLGKIDPRPLRRNDPWVDTTAVHGLADAEWVAPRILTDAGNRAFRVTYGRNFLPSLTKRQAHLIAMAEEARAALINSRDESGVDMDIACRWAAEFISEVHFLTPDVIAVCRLLDDSLVISTLAGTTALPLGLTHA